MSVFLFFSSFSFLIFKIPHVHPYHEYHIYDTSCNHVINTAYVYSLYITNNVKHRKLFFLYLYNVSVVSLLLLL